MLTVETKHKILEICHTKRPPKWMVYVCVVGVTGFSAGLRLYLRIARRARSPALPRREKRFTGSFFHAASNPVD